MASNSLPFILCQADSWFSVLFKGLQFITSLFDAQIIPHLASWLAPVSF